jgi:hypothetical protein
MSTVSVSTLDISEALSSLHLPRSRPQVRTGKLEGVSALYLRVIFSDIFEFLITATRDLAFSRLQIRHSNTLLNIPFHSMRPQHVEDTFPPSAPARAQQR